MPAHQWHLSFDRVICRACGARFSDGDGMACKGTGKVRPRATAVRPVAELGRVITVCSQVVPLDLVAGDRAIDGTSGHLPVAAELQRGVPSNRGRSRRPRGAPPGREHLRTDLGSLPSARRSLSWGPMSAPIIPCEKNADRERSPMRHRSTTPRPRSRTDGSVCCSRAACRRIYAEPAECRLVGSVLELPDRRFGLPGSDQRKAELPRYLPHGAGFPVQRGRRANYRFAFAR